MAWTRALERVARALLTLLFPALVAARAAAQSPLPADLDAALQLARIAPDSVAVIVQELGSGKTLLAHNPRQPMNPASVIKLLTTAAALDLLGPAWTWSTPVWLQGRIAGGVLEGQLHIKGSGDPKLVQERMWLLLRRVQQLGVREIRGDIVLDNSAFEVSDGKPGDFDGEATRPYNARPAALLFNYRAVIYTFTPDVANGVAWVGVEPPLAGLQVQRTVPLASSPCGDWAGELKASFAPGVTRFGGSYAIACAEQYWAMAESHPASYAARFIEGLWREMGGRLTGKVREGPAPSGVAPSFEHRSPPLVEVVREINKFSNNVMAQQLFYTLALQRQGERPATAEAAREVLRRWWNERLGDSAGEPVIDNGSGLSRETRISAQQLARLLAYAHESPWMPELMSSLPINGVDGTMRRSRTSPGRAHIKTGSLRDVSARAGYVLSNSGRRYLLVAMVQHTPSHAARPALDALVQWVLRDGAAAAR